SAGHDSTVRLRSTHQVPPVMMRDVACLKVRLVPPPGHPAVSAAPKRRLRDGQIILQSAPRPELAPIQLSVIGLNGLDRRAPAVCDVAHQRYDSERRFGEVDLAAEKCHPCAIAFGLSEEFEGVAGGTGAAPEHADDKALVERRQLFERLRTIVDNLEKLR